MYYTRIHTCIYISLNRSRGPAVSLFRNNDDIILISFFPQEKEKCYIGNVPKPLSLKPGSFRRPKEEIWILFLVWWRVTMD